MTWQPEFKPKSIAPNEPKAENEVDVRALCTVKTEGAKHTQILVCFRLKKSIVSLLEQGNIQAKSMTRQVIMQLVKNHCEKEKWPSKGRKIKINSFRAYPFENDPMKWEALNV